MVINTVRLRCLLGWLGMLLPWLAVILMRGFPPSISVTYYGPTENPTVYNNATIAVFMIILGAAAFLLISYRGYGRTDDILNTCAGVAGLLICLFPCGTKIDGTTPVGTFGVPVSASNIVHTAAAFVFFALLSFNSLFLFTKSGGFVTENKQKRNLIYRICGIGMLASFLLLLFPAFYIRVWLVETVALTFFGISFLTKANRYPWLFCDGCDRTA